VTIRERLRTGAQREVAQDPTRMRHARAVRIEQAQPERAHAYVGAEAADAGVRQVGVEQRQSALATICRERGGGDRVDAQHGRLAHDAREARAERIALARVELHRHGGAAVGVFRGERRVAVDRDTEVGHHGRARHVEPEAQRHLPARAAARLDEHRLRERQVDRRAGRLDRGLLEVDRRAFVDDHARHDVRRHDG
jgi:hypothetical protein